MLNPNGPLLNGGSDGDNGQTGRKLVMDYYGPRIPIGGGALFGKDPTHIDRVGAKQAREMALGEVRSGAGESLVRLTYAPGVSEPIDIAVEPTRGLAERSDHGRRQRRGVAMDQAEKKQYLTVRKC